MTVVYKRYIFQEYKLLFFFKSEHFLYICIDCTKYNINKVGIKISLVIIKLYLIHFLNF